MSGTFLLVDFENVHALALSRLPVGWHVRIFYGRTQKKFDAEVVTEAQPLGDRLQWIKIEGNGPNNLDFHLAFYLGELVKAHHGATFVILTKDKGLDPLIRHLSQRGTKCRRVCDFAAIASPGFQIPADPNLDRVCKILSGMKKSRPGNRKSLVKHVHAEFQKKLPEADVLQIVDRLIARKLVSETKNAITYHF